MLNSEKYRDELKSLNDADRLWYTAFDKYNMTLCDCSDVECENCAFNSEEGCNNARYNWLLSEYVEPIKLSKLEYDILKYLSDNTRHMYITRDGNGIIFLYDVEPEKSNSAPWWTGRGMCHMSMFNKLFQFVQWEDSEPTSIQEVLENCEVVDYD